MARVPTPTSRSTVLRQPVASPVDTYVAPGPSNSLLELAGSLRQLSPGLGEFFEAKAARQKEADQKQADADFLAATAEGRAEGVRQGLIPPQASRAYMERYKANQGEAMGRRLRAGFLPAWDAWAGKNSDDPQAFDAFFADYMRTNVATDDPDIIAGLRASAMQLHADALDTHSRFRTQQTREGALQAELAGVNGTLDDAYYDGLASGAGTDHAASADAIERQRQAYIATGGTGDDFDKNAMGLIAAKAVELGDEKLLGFFDRTVPGQDYTYGQTPEGSRLKREAAEQLAVKARQAVVEGDRAAEAERKAREGAAQRAAIEAMVAGGAVPEEVLAAGERADPLFRTKVGEWRENLSKGARDPALVKQIKDEIVAGGGVQAVIGAMPGIESGDDLSDLITFAKSFEGARPTIDDVLGSASARNVLSALDSRTKKTTSFLDPVTGMTNEGMEAQHDFRMMVAQWATQNPNASAMNREEAVARMGTLLLGRLEPSKEDPAISVYDRDPEAVGGFDNPYTDRKPDAQPTPAAQPAPAPQDDRNFWERNAPTWLGGEEAPQAESGPQPSGTVAPTPEPGLSEQDAAYFGTFSPEQQAELRALAQSRNAPLASVLEHARKKGLQPAGGPAAPDGTPIDPVAYRPDEPDTGGADERVPFTREMADAILQAVMAEPESGPSEARVAKAPDARAGRLLDMIAQHEAAGNYNAVYGKAGSKRDLSAFTLDEILGQQQAARRRGAASTAIGRYQFIFKTLRGLKTEMGLSGTERFTPELQDRLGMALLERRGYSEFAAGRLSKRQFAFRLSQEWASLPDPRTGRSFYAGDGLNAAGTSTQAVYAALGFKGGPAPSATMAAYAPTSPSSPSGGDPYANIPEAERDQFRQWNSDPVANHETNLASIDQTLAGVVRRAQELSGVRFVVGSGLRDDALQAKAVEWGWSKTHDSDHEHGGAVDLWGLDGNGGVTFDPETQTAIVKAMKQAASELGVDLDVGADWEKFKDNPHFAIKGRSA